MRASGLAGNVARFLGREHQASGRDRPQARLCSLDKGERGRWRRVIAGQGPGERCRSDHWSLHLGLASSGHPCDSSRVMVGPFSTIVIVEESPAVQELVEQAVREVGDCVLVTQNALEVLEVARRVRIDLLVIDIDSAQGLVEELRESQPDLRVLYVSDRTDEQQAGLEDGLPLLTPFSLGELRAAVAALLDRSESGVSGGAGTGP
jgi:CheY-like chemotaxis protein